MKQNQAFLSPQLKISNLDLFIVRKSILRELNEHLPYFTGTLLDIGCGNKPYHPILTKPPSQIDKYIGLDILGGNYDDPDVGWDGLTMPFANDAVNCAVATEVLEHCPRPDRVLKEASRVLKPGGLFFFTVPFLWPLHDTPYDEYRYTPFALKRLLRDAGFVDIEIKAMGGWDASLAQMIGLWVRRRSIPRLMRPILSILCFPLLAFLIWRDEAPFAFIDNSMFIGISGSAVKD